MNLGEIVLKIRAGTTDFGNRVAGTVEFALAQEFTVKDETAFVIPLAEADQGDNNYDNGINQMINERFGIVVALKNDASIVDKLGIGAFDRLNTVRTQLHKCLLGWLPSGADMPVYYKGGRLLDINPAWLWYQFEYQSEIQLTANVDGIDSTLGPWDDFTKAYAQWLAGDVTQAILPMTGTPPVLPETLVSPDMESLIDFKYEFSDGFGKGFNTLKSEAEQ